MYVFNAVTGAIVTLVSPVAVGIFFAWLLTERAGVGDWIYVVLIILGVMSGLVGMVRFVLSSMAGIERLEGEQAQRMKNKAKMKERSATEKNEE